VQVRNGGNGHAGLGNGRGITAELYGLILGYGVLESYGILSGNGRGGLKIYGLKSMGYDRGDCNRKCNSLHL
jgi:hypothetical protein